MTQDDIDNNKCCKYVHYTTALTAGVTCILQGNSARDTRHWSLTKQNDCIISVLWTHIMYLYLFGTAHKLHYRDINGAGASRSVPNLNETFPKVGSRKLVPTLRKFAENTMTVILLFTEVDT